MSGLDSSEPPGVDSYPLADEIRASGLLSHLQLNLKRVLRLLRPAEFSAGAYLSPDDKPNSQGDYTYYFPVDEHADEWSLGVLPTMIRNADPRIQQHIAQRFGGPFPIYDQGGYVLKAERFDGAYAIGSASILVDHKGTILAMSAYERDIFQQPEVSDIEIYDFRSNGYRHLTRTSEDQGLNYDVASDESRLITDLDQEVVSQTIGDIMQRIVPGYQ